MKQTCRWFGPSDSRALMALPSFFPDALQDRSVLVPAAETRLAIMLKRGMSKAINQEVS